MSTIEGTMRRWRWSRWWELVPEAVLAGGLGYFFFDEMDAATSAFKSGRAVTLMIGVAAAWLAARLLLWRLVRWPVLRLVPFLAGGLAILAIVVLPAYRTHTVVERLRAGPALESDASSTQRSTPEAEPVASAAPQLVRSSAFRGIDHRARGTVNVYRRGDGRHVIGLEDFDIQPGPDYDVYVVPGADRTNRDAGTRIDDLRGNAGTQYYEVPAGLDLESGPFTVLVWCQTFGVPVANATPA